MLMIEQAPSPSFVRGCGQTGPASRVRTNKINIDILIAITPPKAIRSGPHPSKKTLDETKRRLPKANQRRPESDATSRGPFPNPRGHLLLRPIGAQYLRHGW